MTVCRIRVTRETLTTGSFDWVTLGAHGAVLASGSADLERAPVRGACEVVLASDLVLLDKVIAPASQQRRLSSALRFLAEDFALPDPERLHVASAPTADRNTLCLAIIDRQWLRSLLTKLSSAGLVATGAYPECLLPPLEPHTWTVVWNGVEGFVRIGVNEGIALDSVNEGNVPVALRLALENARKAGATPRAIVLRSTPQTELPDVEVWSDVLGIPVEGGPEWHWTSAQRRPELDLLRGEFATRGHSRGGLRQWRRAAVLAGVLLAVSSCAIALDWAAKVRERNALLAEMNAVFRESFGDKAVVVNAPLQMSRALAEIRRRSGQTGREDFLSLLGMAGERFLDPGRHRIERIEYENGTLAVALKPRTQQQSGALLEELKAKTPVPEYSVQLESAAGPAGGVVLRLRPGAGQ